MHLYLHADFVIIIHEDAALLVQYVTTASSSVLLKSFLRFKIYIFCASAIDRYWEHEVDRLSCGASVRVSVHLRLLNGDILMKLVTVNHCQVYIQQMKVDETQASCVNENLPLDNRRTLMLRDNE